MSNVTDLSEFRYIRDSELTVLDEFTPEVAILDNFPTILEIMEALAFEQRAAGNPKAYRVMQLTQVARECFARTIIPFPVIPGAAIRENKQTETMSLYAWFMSAEAAKTATPESRKHLQFEITWVGDNLENIDLGKVGDLSTFKITHSDLNLIHPRSVKQIIANMNALVAANGGKACSCADGELYVAWIPYNAVSALRIALIPEFPIEVE